MYFDCLICLAYFCLFLCDAINSEHKDKIRSYENVSDTNYVTGANETVFVIIMLFCQMKMFLTQIMFQARMMSLVILPNEDVTDVNYVIYVNYVTYKSELVWHSRASPDVVCPQCSISRHFLLVLVFGQPLKTLATSLAIAQ